MTKPLARFVLHNDFDTATLSTDAETIEHLEPANLQRYGNSARFRSEQTNETRIIIDWDIKKPLTCCVLHRHNLTNHDDTWRVQMYADAERDILIKDTGFMRTIPRMLYQDLEYGVTPYGSSIFDKWPYVYSTVWFDRITVRSAIITMRSPSNKQGYIDLTRVYMGRHFSPVHNFSWGRVASYKNNVQNRRTAGGSLYGRRKPKYRHHRVSLDYIRDSEENGLIEALRQTSVHDDIFISLYPEVGGETERNTSMVCKTITHPEFISTNNKFSSVTFDVEEA